MSVLTDLIYGGSNAVAGLAEAAVKEAMVKYGAEKEIAFPGTAFFFSAIYALTGTAVKTLEDLSACVDVLKRKITNQDDLDQAQDAGIAAAMGAEIIEGLKYMENSCPYEGETGMGFLPDSLVHSLGEQIQSGTIPGMAILYGKEDETEDVVSVIRNYQAQGIVTFLVGDVIELCAQADVKLGLESLVIPLGHDVTSLVHAFTAAIRMALDFGGIKPGDQDGLLAFTKEKVPAIVNTFGTIDAVVVSACATAMALGFPVIVDIDLGENQIPGSLESICDHKETASKARMHRGECTAPASAAL